DGTKKRPHAEEPAQAGVPKHTYWRASAGAWTTTMTVTVVIIGRPNVGKSTLFNRLVGQRVALVDDEPGVTRDRREGAGNLFGLEFRVIDTAGLEERF